MVVSRVKRAYVCQSCGVQSRKWLGRCPGCGEWNSLVEESVGEKTSRGGASSPAIPLSEVDRTEIERIEIQNPEFDRVLGGGIVPGSLVLLGGEPGIGKSTLLLQVADRLSSQGLRVLYVAGEESTRQIKLRGDRLGVDGSQLFLVSETQLERVFEEAGRIRPEILIVDSIQTLFTENLESAAGSISQVRECAGQLLRYAKGRHVPVFLIGHITKDGALAGPKSLEHIVDVVLYFEGERHQHQKIIRAVKNRFGPANELGIFEMTSQGLFCVENPSQLFLSERARDVSGSVVVCTLEGSRPVLVELQALVTQAGYGTARRVTNGVDPNRLSLLLAMLEKRVGLQLMGRDVYLNVAGGLSPTEPALDLGIVGAVVSSAQDLPICPGTVIFGELGLAGEVRAVSFAHVRVREAKAMGFSRVFLPGGNLPLAEPVSGIELIGISAVRDYLSWLDTSVVEGIE
ncbi:MAG: DNA repair protein RadA [Acidobacteriota bacterium]